MATTDRAADVRIAGNAGPGGRNPLSPAAQAAVNTATQNAVNQVNTSSTTTTAPDPYAAAQSQNRQNWKQFLATTLTNWGLATLIPKVQSYIDKGYTSDTALLMIQNEPEYKQRFAGNEQRIANGFAPLSPQDYLNTEAAYAAAMQEAGLPKGFYDDPVTDFSSFIGNNTSASEVQSRINLAANFIDTADPLIADQLQSYYGIDKGAMIAYVLDPKAAMPFINQQVKNAQLGATAARQGVNIDLNTAQDLQNLNINQTQAQQGFKQIADITPYAEKLSSIYSREQGYGQQEAISETFGGGQSAEAARRRRKLEAMEKGQFSGSSGTGKSSFAQQQSGQF